MSVLPNHTRYDFIDLLKGIGIFLVVWGHTMTPRSVYIYSFHMPLFFFLSGFLHKDKPPLVFLKNKINTLYLPYCVFFTFSWLFYLFWYMGRGWWAQIGPQLLKFKSILTGLAETDGNNPIWFLTGLFVVSLLFRLITRFIKKTSLRLGVVFGCSIGGYLLSLADLDLYFKADVALSAMAFYYAGYWVRQNNHIRRLQGLTKGRLTAILLSCFLLQITTAYLNVELTGIETVNMAGNLLGSYPLFYLSAFSGIGLFFLIGYQVQRIPFFNYLGVNSLLILALHKILLLIYNNIFKFYVDIQSGVYGFAITIGVILSLLPLIWLVNRYTPQIVGKKPFF